MDDRYVIAHYCIETAVDLEAAAEALAGEQSSGTFVAVPGETEALRANHRAQVLKCDVIGQVDHPTLPGAAPTDGPIQRAKVSIAYPIVNFGANLPTLVTTLTGNLFELRQFSGLKLLDVELPASLAKQFAMPKFGVAGTRRLALILVRFIMRDKTPSKLNALFDLANEPSQHPRPAQGRLAELAARAQSISHAERGNVPRARPPRYPCRTPEAIAASDPRTTVLTEEEAIRFLRMTNLDARKALYRLRTRRLNPLKSFRAGRDVRFRLADVLEFLEREVGR